MASAVKVLSKVQIGKETVKGTLVAANRRLVGNFRARRIQEMETFQDLDVGLYAWTAQAPLLTKQASELEFNCPLDFQQILLALESGMKGAVTPTGGGADKTWTFTPATATGAVIETYTFEVVE